MALAVLILPAVMGQEAKARARKPKEFPAVSVAKGVPVVYSAVPLDTWTGKVAYLLIEGSVTSGYTRVFAWIPGSTRFGKPMEWKPKGVEGNPNAWFFGELENRDSEGDEKIEMTWRFNTVQEGRAAGSDTVFDYATGKTTARNWGAATWHNMTYSAKVGYACGNRPSGSMDGSLPLEMTWNTSLPLYDTWANVPEQGVWSHATILAKYSVQETRDPKKGRLLCQFAGYQDVTVQKAPPEIAVGLVVAPYMEAPVYTNSLSIADFVKTGFDLDIPYGWYSLQLSGGRYGRFTFSGYFPQINIDPIPIARP
jgi:hypothetical protein